MVTNPLAQAGSFSKSQRTDSTFYSVVSTYEFYEHNKNTFEALKFFIFLKYHVLYKDNHIVIKGKVALS